MLVYNLDFVDALKYPKYFHIYNFFILIKSKKILGLCNLFTLSYHLVHLIIAEIKVVKIIKVNL